MHEHVYIGLVSFRVPLPLHLSTVFELKLITEKFPEIVVKLCVIIVNIDKISDLGYSFCGIICKVINFHYFIKGLVMLVNLELKRLQCTTCVCFEAQSFVIFEIFKNIWYFDELLLQFNLFG